MPLDCTLGRPDRMHRAWAAWLAAGAALETYALATGRAPLTDWARRSLGIEPITPYRPVSCTGLALAAGWTALHLATGRFAPPIRRRSNHALDA